MWLHRAKVPQIAAEMVKAITAQKDIETESPRDVQLDLESVLSQYINDEHEITERAKDMLTARSMPGTDLGRIKGELAKQRRIKIGEEAIDYLLDQLVEMLMHSGSVDEVYAEDFELRRKMREPLRREFAQGGELDSEVRRQLKHVEEGSSLWEVEYKRMLEEVKRRKGL
jgi:hypothetical protein